MKRPTLAFLAIFLLSSLAYGADHADLEAVWKLKDEGLNRSQVMEIISYLSDVHGPRLTGSTMMRRAQQYAQDKFKDWELEHVHKEPFEFGRGWDMKRFSAHMSSPTYAPLIAYPKAWTPGTNGTVRGPATRVDIESEADFERYRGKLEGRFVLTKPPREVPAHFAAEAERLSEAELKELFDSRVPEPQIRPRPPVLPEEEELRRKIDQFFLSEGVAALVEPGQGDDGTVFVDGNTHRRHDTSPVAPQVVMAVEHYNRICRILDKSIEVQLEMEIEVEFLEQDPMDYNVLADLPGTDKKDELVMMGAHFDSWHTGTGATDNASGSAVVMEAIRIIKAAGLQPRRTIRVALWGGEEQGRLGSRAYVGKHFALKDEPPKSMDLESEEFRRLWRQPPSPRPGYDSLAAYFNLDHGTGKIRGVLLQGNEMVRPIFEAWLAPFHDLGAQTISIRNTFGTDHFTFDYVGLPGFQFIQDWVDYFSRTHHSNMDVVDRIQKEDMMQASVIMASFAYHAAMRNEKLPREPRMWVEP